MLTDFYTYIGPNSIITIAHISHTTPTMHSRTRPQSMEAKTAPMAPTPATTTTKVPRVMSRDDIIRMPRSVWSLEMSKYMESPTLVTTPTMSTPTPNSCKREGRGGGGGQEKLREVRIGRERKWCRGGAHYIGGILSSSAVKCAKELLHWKAL